MTTPSDGKKEFNHQSIDAFVWAKEFNRIYPMILKDGEGALPSEATMITWFANAIMAGYDEAGRRAAKENQVLRESIERKEMKKYRMIHHQHPKLYNPDAEADRIISEVVWLEELPAEQKVKPETLEDKFKNFLCLYSGNEKFVAEIARNHAVEVVKDLPIRGYGAMDVESANRIHNFKSDIIKALKEM